MRTSFKTHIEQNFIILVTVGFLVSSMLPTIIGGGDSINVLYRAVVAASSVFVILVNLLKKKVGSGFVLVFSFLFIFLIRVFYDLYLRESLIMWGDRNATYYMQILLGFVVLPVVALSYINYRNLNFKYIFSRIYAVLFIMLFISIIARSGSEAHGRDVGDIDIGVLVYGQFGATLSILSLYRIFNAKEKSLKLLYLCGYVLGFLAIFISASRSPLVALLIVSLLYIFIKTNKAYATLLLASISLFLYVTFYDMMEYLNTVFRSNFFSRIIYAIEEGKTGREGLVSTGVSEFFDSPFFGSSFLLQTGIAPGIYPHNLIVEAFMATGIIGGMIFVFIIIASVKKSFKLLKINSEVSWISLLYFQYLIFAMFSGSIYTSDLFWVYTVLLIGMTALYREGLIKKKRYEIIS